MRYPLLGLADLYRIRGEPTSARAAYQEAIEYAEAAADGQALPPLLAGLACVLPDDELDAAQDLVRRARDMSQGPGRTGTLLASGWLALAAGSTEKGPGRLVSDLARTAGTYPVPVVIVPAHLTDSELVALS